MKENDFTVQCNVCRQEFNNWIGSTPCCGSLASIVGENGEVTEESVIYCFSPKKE